MPEKRRTTLICLLLAVVTLAVYWPATHFNFINYDDPDYVSYNPIVQEGMTLVGLRWAFTTGHASNWHPVTWISHMLDCSVFGPRPGAHHLTNLLLHTANSVLLFLALLQLTRAPWRSALVAALFAWHPLHVESVAWISERKDVLSTFFWMLTLLAYTRYAHESKNKNPKSKISYSLALFLFTLGLLSKPMVVTLPFVLLLLDFWPLRRITDCQKIEARISSQSEIRNPKSEILSLFLEKIPFFILAALDCFATFWAQRGGHSVVSAVALPVTERVANALVCYALYLGKMLWPLDLALPYPYPGQWQFWPAAGCGLLLILVSTVVLLRARREPHLLVGWLWFLGTLVPVIGLVQVGSQFMADRYSYVPLIGIFIMIAWAIPEAWARWPRPGLVFGAVISCILMFLIAGTETQLQYWRNSVTLFAHTLDVTRNNLLAEYNLAEALAREGDAAQAIEHYQKCLAIQPNRVEAQYNFQTPAHYNLGLLFRAQKNWPAAEAQFRACLQDDPNLARAHDNLGITLIAQHRVDEGFKELQTAARLEPGNGGEAQLLASLESAHAEAGHISEAIATAQKVHDAALAQNRPDLAAAADKRLEQYRARQQSPTNAQP